MALGLSWRCGRRGYVATPGLIITGRVRERNCLKRYNLVLRALRHKPKTEYTFRAHRNSSRVGAQNAHGHTDRYVRLFPISAAFYGIQVRRDATRRRSENFNQQLLQPLGKKNDVVPISDKHFNCSFKLVFFKCCCVVIKFQTHVACDGYGKL